MKLSEQKIQIVRKAIGVGKVVAEELLTLAGGDTELVIKISKRSSGLDQCKAGIINARMSSVEEDIRDMIDDIGVLWDDAGLEVDEDGED